MAFNSAIDLDVRRLADGFSFEGGGANVFELSGASVELIGVQDVAATMPDFAAATLSAHQEYTAKGDILAASAVDTPEPLAVGTDGQILVADSTAPLGLSWQSAELLTYELVNASKQAEAGIAYIVDATSVAKVVLTLPASAGLGATVKVYGMSPNLWGIAQNAGDQIVFLSAATTSGATGTFDSTTQYDAVELVHTVGGQWLVVDSSGNFELV